MPHINAKIKTGYRRYYPRLGNEKETIFTLRERMGLLDRENMRQPRSPANTGISRDNESITVSDNPEVVGKDGSKYKGNCKNQDAKILASVQSFFTKLFTLNNGTFIRKIIRKKSNKPDRPKFSSLI